MHITDHEFRAQLLTVITNISYKKWRLRICWVSWLLKKILHLRVR